MSALPSIDLSSLPQMIQRIVSPLTPPPMRMMAAKAGSPGLRPEQIVMTLILLARGGFAHVEPQVAETAEQTLRSLAAPVLQATLASLEFPVWGLDAIADLYAAHLPFLEKLLSHPHISAETIVRLAATGNEQTTELIAVNEQRLLQSPRIIECLYLNKQARMSTAERLIALAVRNQIELSIPGYREIAESILGEGALPPKPTQATRQEDDGFTQAIIEAEKLDEALAQEQDEEKKTIVKTDDEGNEEIDEKALPLDQQIRKMNTSKKIRLAILGSASARAILVRDKNKQVAVQCVRSPLVKENEIAAFASNRSLGEDVLRAISNSEFIKSHAIKYKLIENPKTPVAVSMKLLPHLRVDELKRISKSKNVQAQIARAATQELSKKKQP